MILEYYGLRDQPFGVTPDPRFLYFSGTHREALASLFYGIETGCGFLALIALPGMGKTTLLFHLLERLRGSAQTVFLFQTQCGSREFFRYLLKDLGVDANDQDLARMHESLNSVLLSNARIGRRFVLVIDEAQNLEDSVLETVRLLSDFETPQAKLIQIVLSGQPQLADRLSHPALMQLRQRISIVSRLHPFTRVEMMVYIEYRLHVAGYSGPPLFKYDAIAQIAAHSGGVPRNINNICFNALTLGYAKRRKQIDASIVSEVLADFDIGALSSHSMTPALPNWDSLSSFDGLAPTDEPSYQDFHTAVRAAWGNGAGGRVEEGYPESDLLLIMPGGESNSLAAVSQGGAPAPTVQHSPQAPPRKVWSRTPGRPTPAAPSAEAPGSPVEPSRSELKARPRENKTPTPASFARPTVCVATAVVVAFTLIAGAFVLANRHTESALATRDAAAVLSAPATVKSVKSPMETDPSGGSKTPDGQTSAPRDNAANEPVVVKVGPGQTLSGLSMRYQGRFDPQLAQEIQRLNPEITNPDLIIAGKQVRLPRPSADNGTVPHPQGSAGHVEHLP